MKKIFGILAFAGIFSACGLADAVDDINEAVKNAANQVKIENAFDSAITQVTLKVLDVALEQASNAITAPAAPMQPQSDIGTVTVDESVTTDEGATITVKGTVTGTLSATEGSLTLEFDTTWSGLKVVLDDGSTVNTSGSQTISGSFTIANGVVNATITNKGEITIDGKSYAFDIALTYDSSSNTVSYTGTVNGVTVIRSITLPADEEEEEEEETFAQCKRDDGDVCVSYTTAEFACEDLTDATFTAVDDCESEAEWIGKCTIQGHSVQYFNFNSESECSGKDGTWESL